MRRREFISLLASTVAWPLAASGQQPAKPVIGFLRPTRAEESGHLVAAVREGLRELDYSTGQVVIEPRWGDGQESQMPKLAAETGRSKCDRDRCCQHCLCSGSESSYLKHFRLFL